MSKQKITTINGVDIYAETNENGILVPVKPICDAIGVNFKSQYEKIQNDEMLSSTMVLSTTVGGDGKDREMVTLPLKYVYGWLFTINPGKVSQDAKERVIAYRRECYEVLYEHFTKGMARTIEENEAEIALLKEENEILTAEKELKARHKKVKESLQKLRAERLNPQPRLM